MIGFSVNDRTVMYDRLREIRAKLMQKTVTFAQQVNLAVNQTFVTNRADCRDGGDVGGDTVLVRWPLGTTSTVYVAGALDVDWSAWADRRRGNRPGSGRPGRVRRAAAAGSPGS